MEWIKIAIEIAVISYVYANVLTEADHLLGWLKYAVTGIVQKHPKTEWIFKPIILCNLCVAGQMMLWMLILYGYSLLSLRHPSLPSLNFEVVQKGLFALFLLSLAILLSKLLNKIDG